MGAGQAAPPPVRQAADAHLDLSVAPHHHLLCQQGRGHSAVVVHTHTGVQAGALQQGAPPDVALAAHHTALQACASIHGAAAAHQGTLGHVGA